MTRDSTQAVVAENMQEPVGEKMRPMLAEVGEPIVLVLVVVAVPRGADTGSAGDPGVGVGVKQDGSNLTWPVGYLCLHRT